MKIVDLLRDLQFRREFNEYFSSIPNIVKLILTSCKLIDYELANFFESLYLIEHGVQFSSLYKKYLGKQTLDQFIMSMARIKNFPSIPFDDNIIRMLERVTYSELYSRFEYLCYNHSNLQWSVIEQIDCDNITSSTNSCMWYTMFIDCHNVDELIYLLHEFISINKIG